MNRSRRRTKLDLAPSEARRVRVAIFCGGRGSATIIRELSRWSNVDLTLLVNAYDDGLSTGALREFIPGMLGPSDFRKNMSNLLDLYSNQQYALQRLLEYRMPRGVSDEEVDAIRKFSNGQRHALGRVSDIARLVSEFDDQTTRWVQEMLSAFFAYSDAKSLPFDFSDCSVGNIIFAGAFLRYRSFNGAARHLGEYFSTRADIANVSSDDNRSLVALKENGELLSREEQIVGPQSGVPISELYFLAEPLTEIDVKELEEMAQAELRRWLAERSTTVNISADAEDVLANADVVIYGPGTQHSSLLPSYRIAGEAIRSSPARVKAFVLNLQEDHDIVGLEGAQLVDLALRYMGDPENDGSSITHILAQCSPSGGREAITIASTLLDGGHAYRGARVDFGDFMNPVEPRVHSGRTVVEKVLKLYDESQRTVREDELDIYVDLAARSLGLDNLLQEFLEIDWQQDFGQVRLSMNRVDVPARDLPDHLSVKTTYYSGRFSEVSAIYDWLRNGTSEYMVTLSGDGEYRLRDVVLATKLLRESTFGMVNGSRVQSREQFRSSLHAAYGEGTLLNTLSVLGTFLVTAVCGARLHLIFSDPLTGFHVFRRRYAIALLDNAPSEEQPSTPVGVLRALLRGGAEVAEVPISYRTFTGFSRPSWRLKRGMANLMELIR